MKRFFSLSMIFLFGTIIHTNAQTLYSDRPGDGYSARTTSGFVLEAGGSLNDDISDIGQLHLRFGVGKNAELQFDAGSVVFANDESDLTSQAALFKYQFHNDGKIILTGLVRTVLPFINQDDLEEDFSTRIGILADFNFSPKFMLNANLGYGEFFNDIDDGSFNFNVTPFIDLTNTTALYFGYAVLWYDDSDADTDKLEIGIAHKLDRSFQLDVGIMDIEGTTYLNFGIAKAF
ncbi:MAG: hypothetical protein ED557_11275 [Balneola sp.]|nr:MAG: hypothetical protein ED557_11275 [Balneola sp.]